MVLYTNRLPVAGPGLANFSFPEDQALLVVGDAHGQNDALRDLLALFGRMPTMGKRRTLVFLGDLIDRGPDSLGCMNTALNDAQELAGVDEVVYLPGNHELMLADALAEANKGSDHLRGGSVAECWGYNGGMAFMVEAFNAAGLDMPKDPAEMMLTFAEMLPHPGHASAEEMFRAWPSHFKMGDVLCVHAGITPKKPHAYTLDLTHKDHFPENRLADASKHDRHWAWIRDKFLAWQGGWPTCGTRDADGVLVLHGHTVPPKCRNGMEHGGDVEAVFSRIDTNARLCLDGGAARDIGVAGAVIAENAVRVCFAPT